jgi:hypothetical protein
LKALRAKLSLGGGDACEMEKAYSSNHNYHTDFDLSILLRILSVQGTHASNIQVFCRRNTALLYGCEHLCAI